MGACCLVKWRSLWFILSNQEISINHSQDKTYQSEQANLADRVRS